MTQKSLLKRKHLRHFMYFIASKRGDSANGTADEILYRLPFSGAIIRSPAIHPRGIRNSWTIRDEKRKTLKKKNTVSLEKKFSRLNFTIWSQLDESINLIWSDDEKSRIHDRRFEKGCASDSPFEQDVSHASNHHVYSLSGVGHLCGNLDSNRIPARVSSRIPSPDLRRRRRKRKRRGRRRLQEISDEAETNGESMPPSFTSTHCRPSLPSSWKKGRGGRVGAVSTPAFPPTLIVSENPPQAAHRHDCSLSSSSSSSLSSLLSLRMHGEDLNFNESRGSSICFLG